MSPAGITSSCVPRPQNTGGRCSCSSTSPGKSPIAAYPLSTTTASIFDGARRSACSETAPPCEKPSSAIDVASAAFSSSQVSSDSAAMVMPAASLVSSESIAYHERPGIGQGGVSGAATAATAMPSGR